MKKLIDRKLVQYIKNGYILYASDGAVISSENFPETDYEHIIKSRFAKEYWKTHRRTKLDKNFPTESRRIIEKENLDFEKAYQKFLSDNYELHGDKYLNKNSKKRKERLKNEAFVKDLKPTQYSGSGFYRDKNGFLYRYTGDQPELIKNDVYIDGTNQLMLKSYDPSQSDDPEDKIADIKEIQGKAARHDYKENEVYYYKVKQNDGTERWAARYVNPTKGQKAGWWWVAEYSTGYSKGKRNQLIKGKWVPVQESTPQSSDNQSSGNPVVPTVTQTIEEENPVQPSVFTPLEETDKREFIPSVINKPVEQTTTTTNQYRLVPKTPPVSRPDNMPLMNRGDVRYTISDVTGNSPYFSSDVELVNSLANTSDKNMFKQALMNRLGMSSWDSTTALNRLNYLGIKGHIGGSDRKRLRNLINKGTTVEGKIRN